MSIESLGLWGCTRSGALDIWNNCRTYAYMQNCGRGVKPCTTCEAVALLPVNDDPQNGVRQGPGGVYTPTPGTAQSHLAENTLPTYTTPTADSAWWYDPCRPESAGFFGLEVLRVTGLYENTRDVTVTTLPQGGCGNGLLYSDPIDNGYEITVEGILHGATCCAVRYGYLALKKALRGCCGGSNCNGTAFRYLPCVPSTMFNSPTCAPGGACDLPSEDSTSAINPWRFIKNAKIIDEPSITAGAPDGQSCPSNCGCAPDTYVSFTIRAESGQYTCTKALIDTDLVGTDHCITDISLCDCVKVDPLSDPDCFIPVIPTPPNAASSCFCPIFSTDRKCIEFELPPSLFDYQLEFEVTTGSGKLKNFRVALWKKYGNLGMASGIYDKCNQCAGLGLTPLPAGTTWSTNCGGVLVAVPGHTAMNGNRTLLDSGGRPSNACMRLGCGKYIMCIYTQPNFAPADARFKVSYRYVEP